MILLQQINDVTFTVCVQNDPFARTTIFRENNSIAGFGWKVGPKFKGTSHHHCDWYNINSDHIQMGNINNLPKKEKG